jgi:hypothetical protein
MMRALCILGLLAAMAAYAFGDALGDARAREAEVARVTAEAAKLEARQRLFAGDSSRLAAEIDKLKSEPVGVRRDSRLEELLAAQKARSDELALLSPERHKKQAQLTASRRALVAACDKALAGALPEATRFELQRLRTAQVTLLASPAAPLGRTQVEIDPLDGPRELAEKADLLRDSEDKLRREVARLAVRIDDVERRRHLRERAGAVDEDWFGEATSNRRVARQPGVGAARTGGNEKSSLADGAGGGNQAPAAPPAAGAGQGGGGVTGGPAPAPGGSFADPGGGGRGTIGSGDVSVLRNLVDPATLAELRRADGSDDLERQLRALRRAQGELEGLAKELNRRANTLSTRAAELKKQK